MRREEGKNGKGKREGVVRKERRKERRKGGMERKQGNEERRKRKGRGNDIKRKR